MEAVEQQPESGSRTKVVGGVNLSGPPKSVTWKREKVVEKDVKDLVSSGYGHILLNETLIYL